MWTAISNYDRSLYYSIRGIFFLTILFFMCAVQAAPRLPSANRECAICHIMWLADFKRKDVTPLVAYDPKPVVETGKQDVVSTEKMCFSCHDGFVLDSRESWKNRHNSHPLGVKPSAKVNIPTAKGKTIFPLNNDGKVYCGTCHTAHGVDWEQKDSPIFMRMKNIKSSICIACHLEHSTGSAEGNHPILKKLKNIPAGLAKAGARFGPGREVICQSCHRVHGAQEKRQMVVSNRGSRLCTTCHSSKRTVLSSDHNLLRTAADARNVEGKRPAESGPCSACHLPHGGKGPRLWARHMPTGMDSITSACTSCHSSKGPADKKVIARHSHPINSPLADIGIQATLNNWVDKFRVSMKLGPARPLPLFDRRGRRARKGGNVTCLTCHDPHKWSSIKGSQYVEGARNEGNGRTSFLRIANHKGNLCANCHRQKAAVMLSNHNLEISAPREGNADGQRVSQSGPCSACHVSHNGKAATMWARKVSKQWKGTERLCNSCHKKGGLAKDKQVGENSHPVHVNVQHMGSDQGLPLFARDGTRTDNGGKVDCASCHDSHQWVPGDPANRTGARTNAEGDAGSSFLRKTASGNARLCVSCHKDKGLVSKTDHDLSVTAPNAVNDKGQRVDESGLCGQCHAIHNAAVPLRLWARKLGEGKNAMEKLCSSCHAESGVAHAKVPARSGHPKRLVISNKGRIREGKPPVGSLPVFSEDGERGEIGFISCPTCHDPHRWKARHASAGPGRNVEGSAVESFLRISDSEYFLCADCHGVDSLFRYKYFHWEKSRAEHHMFQP